MDTRKASVIVDSVIAVLYFVGVPCMTRVNHIANRWTVYNEQEIIDVLYHGITAS